MKRILFVDDEARILEGLENLLRRHRKKWQMVFALGGEAALQELDAGPFDVVCTDMRMPKIDGAQVLTHVRSKQPHAVRLVLSGYTDLEATLRAVPVAHQFLSKPCDAATLENVIERAFALQALIQDPAVRRVIGQIAKLPSQPRVYTELVRLLGNADTNAADVARLLEQDMAMRAKLLQLVNSSFFGMPRRLTSLDEAVILLGFNMVKNLVLSVEVFGAARRVEGFSIEALQEHAHLTANIAARLVDEKLSQEAFTAAMLHDIGTLIIATELPDQFAKVRRALKEEKRSLHEVEASLLGVTHAEVGGYLLGLWSLPYPIVEAVANHHAPERVTQRTFDLLGAVYAANILAHEVKPMADEATPTLRAEYLEQLGVSAQLPRWREIAREEVEKAKP